jgi:tetratricopeptide (TPR) repeat protein
VEGEELHEVIERLEHAGHEGRSSLRATVTILILVVTVFTALTGLLAARANRHNAEAQRARAIHTVQAQRADQRAYEEFGQYLDLEAASTASYRRYAVEHRLARSASGSTATQMNDEADAWNVQNGVFQDAFNTIDLAKANAASARPEQEAFSDARAADAWISKEDANIGVAGLFAVCLFLLGLGLTVPGHGVKWGFVAIAVLLATIGVGRALVVNASSVHRVPEASLSAYQAGTLAEFQGNYKKAVTEFAKAVRDDGQYTEGYVALAGAQSADQTDTAQLKAAAASYEKAISLGEDGYLVHNNLGYAYLILGDRPRAAAEIGVAQRLEPKEPFILLSEAEVALVAGDDAAAQRWRDKAVTVLSTFDSAFRDQFFTQLRAQDRKSLQIAGVAANRIDTFFNGLRDIEASLDAYGSAEPRDLNGATLTNLAAVYQKDRGRFEITFDQNDIHSGDVTSTRIYDVTTEAYSPYSSVPRLDVATDPGSFNETAHTPIDAGKWRIELYLNGQFQQSVTVDSPGDV